MTNTMVGRDVCAQHRMTDDRILACFVAILSLRRSLPDLVERFAEDVLGHIQHSPMYCMSRCSRRLCFFCRHCSVLFTTSSPQVSPLLSSLRCLRLAATPVVIRKRGLAIKVLLFCPSKILSCKISYSSKNRGKIQVIRKGFSVVTHALEFSYRETYRPNKSGLVASPERPFPPPSALPCLAAPATSTAPRQPPQSSRYLKGKGFKKPSPPREWDARWITFLIVKHTVQISPGWLPHRKGVP